MNKKLFFVIGMLMLISSSSSASCFEHLARLAIERNLSLKISELEIEQSFIDEKNALNKLIPDLKFNVNKSHTTFKDSYQKSNPSSIDSVLTYSLKLTQTYPGLGQIPAVQRDIARLKTQMRKTAKANEKTAVIKSLAKVYFQLVREQELIKVHKTDLVLIDELLKIANLNLEVGLVLKNDILRIEVEGLNTKTNLLKNQNGFSNLHYDLAAILDYDTTEELKLDLPEGLKFAPSSFTADELWPVLLENDKEIKLAKLDIEILRKAEKVARSAHLPTLTFDGSYNYGRKVGPIEGTKDIKAAFILSTPIYNGNEIENSIRLAKKSRKIATLKLENLKNIKKASLEKVVADYNEALARINFAVKTLEQSYENMRIVFTRYQEGASSIVELVDAQRILTNSAQTAIRAFFDERIRLVEILLLIQDYQSLFKVDDNPVALKFEFLLNQLKLANGENN
ncbi:MAG: TolC family protein [Candidatus Rifleibacteriota bacterium]